MPPLEIARRWFGPLALSLAPLSVVHAQQPSQQPKQQPAQPSTQKSTQPGAKLTDAEAAIAKLVPADALCIIQVPSLDALASTIRSLMHAVAPENQDVPEIDALLSGMLMIPGDIALIDHKKPLAMCFSFDPERFEPVPTFILPVKSQGEFLKSLPPPDDSPAPDGAPKPSGPAKPVVLGDYVGVTELEKYAAAETPRALADKLLPGVISARIDLERLFEITRPMIEPLLAQAEEAIQSAPNTSTVPGVDPKAMAHSYMDGFRTFMNSAETLDLATSMQGDRVDLSLAFTALEKSALADFGSKEKSGVESLAKYLDPDASFSMLVGMDMAAVMKRMEPFITSMMGMYPESMRAGYAASMASFTQVYALLGTAMAVSGDFGPSGMRGAVYFHPKDTKTLVEQYAKVFKEMKVPGVVVQGPEPLTTDGFSLTQFHINVDAKALSELAGDKADPAASAQMEALMKKIYGENGVRFVYGIHEDQMVQVFGGDDAYLHRALAALKDGGRKLSPDIQARLDQVTSANPCFVARIDIARMFSEIMQLALPAAPEDKGAAAQKPSPSAPVTFYGGVDGRIWRGGASWDMTRVASAMKESYKASALGAGTAGASSGTRSKVRADIFAIDQALTEFTVRNNGKYPDSLVVLVTPDVNGKAYLTGNKVPLDPWGREYHYVLPGDGNPNARIFTYGKDGKPGGTGEDADIDDAILFSDEGK